MSQMVNLQNAPRDLEGLKALNRAIKYRLGLALNMWGGDGAAEQAFVIRPEDEQAQDLLEALLRFDQSGEVSAAQQGQVSMSQQQFPPPYPQMPQQQMPQTPQMPQMPPQQPGMPQMPQMPPPPQMQPPQMQPPQMPQGMPPMPPPPGMGMPGMPPPPPNFGPPQMPGMPQMQQPPPPPQMMPQAAPPMVAPPQMMPQMGAAPPRTPSLPQAPAAAASVTTGDTRLDDALKALAHVSHSLLAIQATLMLIIEQTLKVDRATATTWVAQALQDTDGWKKLFQSMASGDQGKA